MDKKFFKECICYEVYHIRNKNDHINVIGKFYNRYINPSTAAVFLTRKMQYYRCKKDIYHRIVMRLCWAKLNKKFGLCIDPDAVIAKGLSFPHPVGIVIGHGVIIGKYCAVYQNVTIGGAHLGDSVKGNHPHIGNHCIIFSGAMVLGSVCLKDNCILAANSVLLQDAESGIYAGSPAKLKKKG